MRRIRSWLKRRTSSKKGASMVEYGLLIALIAVVSIVVVSALGQKVGGAFDITQQSVGPGTPVATGSTAIP
jgi:pilus assembly protein Flp/PilA